MHLHDFSIFKDNAVAEDGVGGAAASAVSAAEASSSDTVMVETEAEGKPCAVVGESKGDVCTLRALLSTLSAVGLSSLSIYSTLHFVLPCPMLLSMCQFVD